MTPRRLAVKALIHQEQAGYANLVLDAELKKCDPPMNTRDAAFAARIFYTTLERLPLLDYTIDRYTKKPVAKLDAPVRAVLRSGLAQAKYMQVPMSAAVNESVRLTKALGKSRLRLRLQKCLHAFFQFVNLRLRLPLRGGANHPQRFAYRLARLNKHRILLRASGFIRLVI